MGLGDPPKMGILWGVWWVRRGLATPPVLGESIGVGGHPQNREPMEGGRNGVGGSPKNGEPYGGLGGIWGLCGAQWGLGGCGALTTSRKKSTWGRLCTKNLTGCLSMTTFGGAKGGQLPHGDPPPYFINAPQPI